MPIVQLIPGVIPPSRECWQTVSYAWQFFPIFTGIQWLTDFYPQGKTSIESKLNIPGKWVWFIMEMPGVLIVLYCMFTIPTMERIAALPWQNWMMVSMYTIHYVYRAILGPLFLNPSMSPIHPFLFFCSFTWQISNGISLGGWLAGYGPLTSSEWAGRGYAFELGTLLWAVGFMANIYHDDVLREIRRTVLRRQKAAAEKNGTPVEGVKKVYSIPDQGLFRYVFYPHFLSEWFEWAGFWLAGGSACIPAQSFLLNEISSMLPRALMGRRWYVERFGLEKVGTRKAIIPGVL